MAHREILDFIVSAWGSSMPWWRATACSSAVSRAWDHPRSIRACLMRPVISLPPHAAGTRLTRLSLDGTKQ
jgi:hypothetical protein